MAEFSSSPSPNLSLSTSDSMRREVAALEQQVRDLKSLQASGRAWVVGTVVIVVLLFGIFSWLTYARVRKNFDQPSVQQAISTHGADVLPLAQTLLAETGREVMPVYRDTAMTTLRTRGPEAANNVATRLRQIPADAGKAFNEKMQAAFAAAVQRISPELKAAFPNVGDDRRQQLLQAFTADQIDAQNKRIATQLDALYTNDLLQMQDVLDKFQVADVPPGPGGREMLEKQFLHTMVALLDNQIDAAYDSAATQPASGTVDGSVAMATTMPSNTH